MKPAPAESPTVLAGDSLVPLESVLCTEELNRRPSRPPDYETENRALGALAQALTDSPRTILQKMAEILLETFRAGSSGFSLLSRDDGGKRFHWPAIAGVWKPHIGGGTPREFGPCGDVLDRNAPLLFRHFERRYTYFQPVTPPVEECLLVPFYVEGKVVGTIWVIAHDRRREFDAEDLRQLVSLGRFVSAAYQAVMLNENMLATNEALLLGSVRQNELTESAENLNEQLRTEITVRKRAEGAASHLAAIVSFSDDAIISKDLKGIIQSWNQGAQRLFGYTAEEAVGKPATLLIPADRIDEEPEILERIGRGEVVDHYETMRQRKDGSLLDISLTISPMRDAAGDVIGASKIARDITEHKQLELELRKAKAVAEEANLAKSDFLSSMSHELRTPLNAILGFAQLMESASPSPTTAQKRSIEQILKAGWYLLELINEILDLAAIESGNIPLSLEPIPLTEVVRECQVMIGPQAQERGIRLVFPQVEVPYFVCADRTRVKQVFINLLSNAIKYNRVGGTVDVDYTAGPPGRIRICVKDTGAGLTPDKMKRLFEPFNRLGKEAGVEEGTGIGLMVSKRLVELMGGVIGVESTVGKGSMFWIELDLAAEPQTAAGAATLAAVAPVPDGRPPRTLLYVEDDPTNLMLVEELIARRPDIRLLIAADGTRGVEMARASQPDVILMDINLPDISGFQALEIIRSDPATAHIPVVALSANAMPGDIEKGVDAGFFSYLTKPIKVGKFMDALDVALKFSRSAFGRAARKQNGEEAR